MCTWMCMFHKVGVQRSGISQIALFRLRWRAWFEPGAPESRAFSPSLPLHVYGYASLPLLAPLPLATEVDRVGCSEPSSPGQSLSFLGGSALGTAECQKFLGSDKNFLILDFLLIPGSLPMCPEALRHSPVPCWAFLGQGPTGQRVLLGWGRHGGTGDTGPLEEWGAG